MTKVRDGDKKGEVPKKAQTMTKEVQTVTKEV